jgi:hypothetical protein
LEVLNLTLANLRSLSLSFCFASFACECCESQLDVMHFYHCKQFAAYLRPQQLKTSFSVVLSPKTDFSKNLASISFDET